MKNYIDIQQATKYTHKSLSTIKRLVSSIKEDDLLENRVLRKEAIKTGFKYTILKGYLKNHFKIKDPIIRPKTAKNNISQKVVHEMANELLKKDVEYLKERIRDKDIQIQHLQATNAKLIGAINKRLAMRFYWLSILLP